MSPRAQIKSGIAPNEIGCKTGFELILKSSDNSPACVKLASVDKLIMRGWGKRV
jgi:S-ribosylhomocysteine lyase LuxS involved in autoinducer biosynthesis